MSSCTIRVLGEKHSENDIKVVSGHSSSSSLGIYKTIKDGKKEEMAMDLAKALRSASITPGQDDDVMNEADNDWLMNEVSKLENPCGQNIFNNNCNVTIYFSGSK